LPNPAQLAGNLFDFDGFCLTGRFARQRSSRLCACGTVTGQHFRY
jgi:hypothetical protein